MPLHPRDAAAQSDVTIEALIGAPFPSNLTASPTGRAVAWVSYHEGRRNVWVATAPDFVGRPVSSYSEDDGQTIANLSFTPNGEHIVFRRGDSPNGRGEYPNPLNLTSVAAQAIHVVPVSGGEPRKLTEGSSPIVSPDGKDVTYLKDRKVWSVPIDGSEEPEVLFSARGRIRSLAWSGNVDNPVLAFVSSRGDHAYVGTFSPGDEAVRYLDPSVDNDQSPVFSPDGKRLAFIRRPNESDVLPFTPRRSALPWSVLVADVETGEVREIWRAKEGTGSNFRFMSASNQILWAAGDRLVFPWERNGWTQLYSITTEGDALVHLTPGEFEVQFVALGHDGKDVLYSSNEGDVDRQHLWRVPASGGTPRQVSIGTGIEWSPVGTSDGRIVALASGPVTPAHPVIIDRGGNLRPLEPATGLAAFPSRGLVEPQQVVFASADGMKIHGQLFVPKGVSESERRPAVIFFHGGSRRQMLLGFHHRRYYHNTYAFNQYLASRGYVVLSVNYRSGIGYGMAFREAIDYGARGASEYRDVVGAGLYLRSRSDVDPDRIGLWGGSYGGYLTALGLARASDLFKAGVDVHGVHDWNVTIRNFAPDYDPVARAEVARLAFESSPLADVHRWRSPVLLIHADDDRNVPFSETVTLVEALRRHGVQFEQIVFPDDVHSFLLHRNWLRLFHASADFLDRHLKPAD